VRTFVLGVGVVIATVVDAGIWAYAVDLNSNSIRPIGLIYRGLGTASVAEQSREVVAI